MNTMSDDAKAIVLLCGRLGGESEAEPLQQREYNRLVGWLKDQKLRPRGVRAPDRFRSVG